MMETLRERIHRMLYKASRSLKTAENLYEFSEELQSEETHLDVETARHLIAMMQTYYETYPSSHSA